MRPAWHRSQLEISFVEMLQVAKTKDMTDDDMNRLDRTIELFRRAARPDVPVRR